MKKLLFLSFVLAVVSCTDELNQDVANNTICVEEDYLSIAFGDSEPQEYFYNRGIGPYGEECPTVLCHFSENNYNSGLFCNNCEGQSATLRLSQDSKTYFPNLPITVGMDYTSYDGETLPIVDIALSGLNINFILQERLTDNLEVGTYELRGNSFNEGVNVYLHWSVHTAQNNAGFEIELGYTLELDSNQEYLFEITCVDRSKPEEIRLTGNFEGFFVGSDFQSNNDIITYQKPIKADFSYVIELQ